MNSSARHFMRSISALLLLLIVIATLAQPVPQLRAQEDDPPPTPTAQPSDSEGSDLPSSQIQDVPYVAVDRHENDGPSPPPLQAEVTAPPTLDATGEASMPAAADAQAPIQPQATNITGFKINVISKALVRAGSDLVYTIYFTNTDNVTYQNVLLQNGIGESQWYGLYNPNLSASERFKDCELAKPENCPFDFTSSNGLARPTLQSVTGSGYGTRQLVWNIGTVRPQQQGKLTYTVRTKWDIFPRTGRPQKVLGNTVALYRDGQIVSNNKLNEDQWGAMISGPVFYLTKKLTTPKDILQGQSISYEISVGNATGPNDQINGKIRPDAETATVITVTDDLPANIFDPQSIVPQDGGAYDSVTRRITWKITQPLKPGDPPLKVHFTAKINTDPSFKGCGNFDNVGRVTSAEIPLTLEQDVQMVQGEVKATATIYDPVKLTVGRSPGAVKVGEEVTWIITANNYWSSSISPTTIEFFLPPNFTYTSSNPPASSSDAIKVKWDNLTLPAKTDFNQPGKIELTVRTRAGRTIDNHVGTAVVTVPATVPSGCIDQIRSGVTVNPLIYATKSVNVDDYVLAGTNVIYTVDLYNISPQTISNVTLKDLLPMLHGLPFKYQGMVGNDPAPTVTEQSSGRQELFWSGLSIPGGSSSNPGRKTINFTVRVDGWPSDCANNEVTPDSEPSAARRVVGGLVCIGSPIGIEKTVDRASVAPRDTNRIVVFTLKFYNRIDSTLTFTPKDQFISGPGANRFKFIAMETGPDGTRPPDPAISEFDTVLEWPRISLAPGQTVYYAFRAELPTVGGVIPQGRYCNRAQAWLVGTPYSYIRPPYDTCVAVTSIKLIVTKTVNRAKVGLGELLVFTIKLVNESQDIVRGLVVSDTLPINMSYVASSNSIAPKVTEFPNGQDNLLWEGLDVQANKDLSLVFTARAPALIGEYLNSVEVTGGNPVPAYVCKSVTPDGSCLSSQNVSVSNLISITKTASPSRTDPGGLVEYTMTVANTNDIPYQNITISDTLPLGFSFVEMVNGPVPFQPRPGVLVWSGQKVSQVGATDRGRLTFVFRARAARSYGSFTSRIETASITGVIPVLDNAGRVLIAPPKPALSLSAPALTEPEREIMLKISLLNPDGQDITGVGVNLDLPAGFTYQHVEEGTVSPTVSGQKLSWSSLTMKKAVDGEPSVVDLVFYVKAPKQLGKYTLTAIPTLSTIDVKYGSASIVVANLRYLYLSSIRTP